MIGIPKSFYKLFSVLTAAALCLGLMITGCSEGDDTPAAVDYNPTGTELDVTVGIAGADAAAEAAAKGFDVPAEAFNMVVSLLAGDKTVIEKSFVAEGSEWDGAAFWTELDGGRVMMSSAISEEELSAADVGAGGITAVLVAVYDKDVSLLGTLYRDDVTLAEGRRTAVDFTAADAPAFKKAEKLTAQVGKSSIDVDRDTEITVMYGGKNVTAGCTFESSDERVATVDASGLVHGVGDGSAVITVSYTPEGLHKTLTADVDIDVFYDDERDLDPDEPEPEDPEPEPEPEDPEPEDPEPYEPEPEDPEPEDPEPYEPEPEPETNESDFG